jgi:hypothetical protein
VSNLQSNKVFESLSFLKVFQVNGVMGVYVMSLKKNYPYSEHGQTYLMKITMNKMLCNSLSFMETDKICWNCKI